jgi:hypothetical protein
MEDYGDEMISWNLWGKKVLARLLTLQRSSDQYLKEVIKSVKLD